MRAAAILPIAFCTMYAMVVEHGDIKLFVISGRDVFHCMENSPD